jgi:hypothetical protein
MANWKKVIVSGSDAELSNLTVTDLTTGGSSHKVVVSDGGVFKQVDQSTVAGAAVAFESASFMGVSAVSGGNLNDFDDTTGIASTNPGAIVFVTGSDSQNINFKMSASSDSTFIHLQAVTHSVVGTTNQVSVSTTSGVSTLTTPQDIHTSATPTFANITINGSTNTASFVALQASGEISSSNFVGNGSALTGITADTATDVTVTNNASEAADLFVTFVDGNIGAQGIETDSSNLTYNPSTGNLSATSMSGLIQTAAQTNITSVGALSGGSISSGFGNIDNGSSTLKTGNATVTHISSSGGITGSGLEIKGDGHFTGDIAIDSGNIFGANGFGIQIDSITSTSGSSAFGTGSAGDIGTAAEATHTFTGSIYATGSLFDFDGPISASAFVGNGAGLTNLNVSNVSISDLTDGNGITSFTYDGTVAKSIALELSGSTGLTVDSDGLYISNGGIGTDQLATDAVTNDKLANITQGYIKVGGGSNAPTDLDAKTSGYILVGDGTDINSVAVSGDVTLANNGTVSIGNDKVNENHLSSSFISASTIMGNSIVADDRFLIYDTSANDNRSTTITQLVAYLNDVNVLTALNANTTYTLEGSQGGSAGDNSVVITLSDSSNNDTVTFNGTTNEISMSHNVSDTDATVINIGLPDDVTIGSDLTVTDTLTVNGNVTLGNHTSDTVTIAGNLTVNGTTTTLNTTELIVDDQFILLNSGSMSGTTDGGILVQEGAATAYALGVDSSADRWALQKDVNCAGGGTLTSLSPDAYMVSVKTTSDGTVPSSVNGGNPMFGNDAASRAGQMHVDTNGNGTIWIYA